MIQPAANPSDPVNLYVLLARLGRPHGVRGMLNVDLAGNHLRDFVGQTVEICNAKQISPVISAPKILKSLTLSKAEPAQGEVKRVAFAELEMRESAAELTSRLIVKPLALMRQMARAEHGARHVPMAQLWYFEIYGLTVLDARNKRPLGAISEIEDLGSNTLVTVTLNEENSAQQREIILPLEYPHWGKADLDRQEITLAEWQYFLED